MPTNLPTIDMGRFPQGADSLHAQDAPVFSPTLSDAGSAPPTRCIEAVNMDFDDDGYYERRSGTSLLSTIEGKTVFGGLGMLFYQDGLSLRRVTGLDPLTSELIFTLSSTDPVAAHEYESWILWTNGTQSGKIDAAGAYQPWSLAQPPAPTLGQTAGALLSGRYLVSTLFVDTNGVEHAASESASFDLTTGALTVDLASVDPEAVSVRVFASKANGSSLFYVGEAAVGSLPVTISDVDVSDEQVRSRHFAPVTPGDGIFSYQGMVITFSGRFLQPSYGPAIHLYELQRTEEERPATILAGVGLAGGYWVVCERGAFFTSGDTPGTWFTTKKDNRLYAGGALKLAGSLIEGMEIADEIALFVSGNGLIAGTSDGQLIPLTADKHRLDVAGKTASIVYREHANFNQILFSLE